MMNNKQGQWYGVFTVIICFVLIILMGSWYTIASGERGVLTTFGEANMVPITEGLHFKVPLVQGIEYMDIKTQKYEADLTASSKDLQDVKIRLAINYRINPSAAAEIFTTIGNDYPDKIIYPLEQETNKMITSQFTAEELITKRDEVRRNMKIDLSEKLTPRNIIIEEVSIVNFEFSPTFTQAIEQKVTAEQNALKEQNNLKLVEFQAQQKVAQAKGEAEAIEIVNKQLSQSPQYINYMTIQKWDGQMPLSLGSGSLLSITPQVYQNETEKT
jgi:regulator of protease activity HflC (stomatin/prohibitin superfamily)